jgi:hypothetical protein
MSDPISLAPSLSTFKSLAVDWSDGKPLFKFAPNVSIISAEVNRS